jgi:hypothetical protein
MGYVPPKLLTTLRKIRGVMLQKINFFANTGVGISNHTNVFLISPSPQWKRFDPRALRVFGSHVDVLTSGINLQ